jgi:hypothetical protein
MARCFVGEIFGRAFGPEKIQLTASTAAGVALLGNAVSIARQYDNAHARKGLAVEIENAVTGCDHDLAQIIGIGNLHLKDPWIVLARGMIGALGEFDAAFFERRLFDFGGTGGDERRDLRRTPDFLRAEVVAVGVSGALSRDDAHADAERNALRCALDDRFVDADGTGGEVFEIEVGIVAAPAQGFREITFQIALRDAKFSREEGIGEAHNQFQCIKLGRVNPGESGRD